MSLECTLAELVNEVETSRENPSKQQSLMQRLISNPILIPVVNVINEELNYAVETTRGYVFSQVRQLNDKILSPYLTQMSSTDRENVAQIFDEYPQEFKDREGQLVTVKKKAIKKNYGDKILLIAQNISSYPKIKQVIEKYLIWRKTQKSLKNASLQNYLKNHDIEGNKVKKYGKDSLDPWTAYDFELGKQLEKKTNENIIQSLTSGLEGSMKEKVLAAESLLDQRKQVIENYLIWNKTQKSPGSASLQNYLRTHDIEGNEVEKYGKDSLSFWIVYNFELGKQLEKKSNENIIQSLTSGLEESMKEKVLAAESLLDQRRQVIENYLIWYKIQKSYKNASLQNYLRTHDIEGNEASGKNSLNSWTVYNFELGKVLEKKSNENIIQSLTSGLEPELRAKVMELN